ncbi:subtilase family protein [Nonlabens xylanidelens]|uniref:Subtilase family protein n=1 Tax=Nonlabens xylanidelens TaxID=191564 RepID=A0A2S6IQG5_9FLAO|nr:S8 family peptidase [Nonlabens xylanidelens]PPK96494.1 subtilase family protein [Nonlabens xylanidelens]PQJ18212.1 peptidase S8 [Nonlabens xylanidelens]
MKYSILKSTFLTVAAAGLLASCGSGGAIVSPAIGNIDSTPLKTQALTDEQAKNWKDMDLVSDTIPGMSVNKAYTEILKGEKGKTVIVAVIDSGVDVEHEDLDGVIWTNKGEIAGNGKDDDNNGYIDDVHGWNFLGDIVDENLEYERIVRDKAMLPADVVAKAQKEYDGKVNVATLQKNRYEELLQSLNEADKVLTAHLGKSDYTKEEVLGIKTEDESIINAQGALNFFYVRGLSSAQEGRETLTGLIDGVIGLLNGDNLKTNYRKDILNDDQYVWDTPVYGNNEYSGPDPEKADAFHGTHVAGIIAAERDNGLGVNGVANNVEIMVLRAVSTGDEYDKDIAKAIRYAADNGAKVINGSFGKYHSPNAQWVWDAIKYAETKDVLFVNAAGNEGIDTDFTQVYPQDQVMAGTEISDNFLTVGALNFEYGSGLLAGFSNYGKSSVDVFAPGVAIYSTAPLNEYRNAGGTSMASPATAGVAAVIRSQYPKLTASQVKHVIMDSGLTTSARVIVGGNPEDTKPFAETTVSGKMVNLYNALILASKI